ncbi:universal stress protein [Tomitella biformata]|uniref:universal stress protein n=1 Tax=Tomitella biformata TaxID=630403 RepID=UPI000467095F|nr:universal stress protein [Tomitella biformata]
MNTVKPVVVGTDGSAHAERAVQWAAPYAALHDTPLLIATATSVPVAYGMDAALPQELFDALRIDGQRLVTAAAHTAAMAAPDANVRTEIVLGASGAAMLKLAENASTLVVGARGHGSVASAILGSVSSLVVRHAHCPVVVVGEDEPAATDSPVIVGVDDSANSDPAVAAAFREAAARGATLVAVHAWSDVPVAAFPSIQVRDRYDEEKVAAEVLTKGLAPLRREHPNVIVEQVVVMDQPDSALVDKSAGAALVVVGSRGRGGVAGLLLGSTSRKVLRSAACPVMVVKS